MHLHIGRDATQDLAATASRPSCRGASRRVLVGTVLNGLTGLRNILPGPRGGVAQRGRCHRQQRSIARPLSSLSLPSPSWMLFGSHVRTSRAPRLGLIDGRSVHHATGSGTEQFFDVRHPQSRSLTCVNLHRNFRCSDHPPRTDPAATGARTPSIGRKRVHPFAPFGTTACWAFRRLPSGRSLPSKRSNSSLETP